jgi:hypothetical protein
MRSIECREILGYNRVINIVTWRNSPVVACVDLIGGKATSKILGNYFPLVLISPYDPLAAPDKIGKSVCVRSFF